MEELWIHHTVTTPTADPLADARTVQQAAFDRGFYDISYSYLAHPSGAVLEGRGDLVGAHTKGRNEIALAIAFIGNYMDMGPTVAQLDAARWLRDELVRTGRLRPGTYPTAGHRDNPLSPSACPGDRLYAQLDALRVPHDTEGPEAFVKTKEFDIVKINQHHVHVTLDGNGNGYNDVPAPVERVVGQPRLNGSGLEPYGPYRPYVESYGVGGVTRVEVNGGPPNQAVDLTVSSFE